MLFFYRLLLLILTFCLAVILLIILYWNSYFYLGVLVSGLLAFSGSYFLLNKKLKNWRQSASYSFLPLLLLLGGIFYLVFVEHLAIKIGVIILTDFLFFISLNEILRQIFVPQVSNEERLTNSSLLVEVVVVFYFSAGLLGLRDFLSISLWLVSLIFVLVVAGLAYYLVFAKKKVGINKIFLSLIIALVMVELFWAIAILSLVYYLKGLVISFFYLVIMELVLSSLVGKSSGKMMRNFIIIIFIILTLVMYTSKWF